MPAFAIAVGTTSTTLLAANPSRSAFAIINPPGSGQTIWVNVDGIAAVSAPPSVPVVQGDSFTWRGTRAVTGIAAGSATITVLEH